MRILALIPDAFGGHGGIAQFNRDLLTALCAHPACAEVVAIPRLMPNPPETMPQKLTYVTEGINSKLKYIISALRTIWNNPRFDLIVCGHINLVPAAYLCQVIIKAPLTLIMHGIDAWQPTRSWFVNRLVRGVNSFISVSALTKQRFLNWSKVDNANWYLLPNSVDLDRFTPGPKNSKLVDLYVLKEKTVLMTLGRLAGRDRYKGFDEVMEVLPDLSKEITNVIYLIAGDGKDRGRLEEKAKRLGVSDRVVFTGFVFEEEKADHYRLADAYVMPSRGEGFGIVILEAMACGISVVVSSVDGSREAISDGKLGIMIDPSIKQDLIDGILEALKRPKGVVPSGLEYFSYQNFQMRCHQILDQLINK